MPVYLVSGQLGAWAIMSALAGLERESIIRGTRMVLAILASYTLREGSRVT